MTCGLLLTGGVPLELVATPNTREMLLHVLGITPTMAPTPLKRHRTGLVATGLDESRREIGEVDLFIVARADAAGGPTMRVFDIEVPAPALLVGQKAGCTDFSEWIGYAEKTGFVQVREDLRAVLQRGEAIEQVGEPDARYNLSQLEGSLRDLGNIAPKRPGVLRLVALDPLGNVAAAANFIPTDWLGLRNFALRAFDSQWTCYVEGVLRASAPVGSTAETPPVAEYIRWSLPEQGKNPDVQVKLDGEAIAHGTRLSKPVPFKQQKAAPMRVPVAGLPVFRADGESKPVIWRRIETAS